MSVAGISAIASVQPVSTTPPNSPTPAQMHLSERRAEMHQLNEALQARDLNAAQQAYVRLVALSNLNAIGAALQSGNLDGAQQAFTALQSTYQHELPPAVATSAPAVAGANLHNASSAAPAPSGVPDPTSTTATSLTDQNTINLAKAASAQEVAPHVGAGNGSKNSAGGVNIVI